MQLGEVDKAFKKKKNRNREDQILFNLARTYKRLEKLANTMH